MRAQHAPDNQNNETKDTARNDAFSDGVFAIVITLLTFQLAVPTLQETAASGGLLRALAAQWPTYAAFVISYLTILVMWVNHHRLMGMIYRTDHNFLILNGLLLLGVTIVPFTTALLASYINQPDAPIASALYSGLLLLIALMYQAFWAYAARGRRLIGAGVPQREVDAVFRQYCFGPLLYGATVLLSFVSVPLSVLIVFGLAVYFVLPLGRRTDADL